jgi:hypothetical protein
VSDGTGLSNVLTTATLFGSEAVLKYLLEKRLEFRKLVNMPAKVVVDIFWNLVILSTPVFSSTLLVNLACSLQLNYSSLMSKPCIEGYSWPFNPIPIPNSRLCHVICYHGDEKYPCLVEIGFMSFSNFATKFRFRFFGGKQSFMLVGQALNPIPPGKNTFYHRDSIPGGTGLSSLLNHIAPVKFISSTLAD